MNCDLTQDELNIAKEKARLYLERSISLLSNLIDKQDQLDTEDKTVILENAKKSMSFQQESLERIHGGAQ